MRASTALSLPTMVLALLLSPSSLAAANHAEDEAAIRASAQGYATAFTKRDAKKLAEFWAPDAVHQVDGNKIVGREAIEKAFAAMFREAADVRLSVKINSIRFVTDDVAIEDGTALVRRPGEATEESAYTAVHVRKDGKWLLDSVRETATPAATSPFEKLKELDWMVGDWVDDSGGATVRTSVKWMGNGAFLVRTFSISIGDTVALEGGQVVGYDPVKKQIRSWAFDSDGGFSEAQWTCEGNQWTVRSKNTLADGRQGTATTVFRYIDQDRFGWKSISRDLEGELLPNVDEVEVVRETYAADAGTEDDAVLYVEETEEESTVEQ